MSPPSLLYETLLNLLQHAPWRDRRPLLTLAWMVMGLLSSGWIALSEWTPFVVGRALLAQSTERRFGRWLSNPRIDVLHLYAALPRPVLGDCPDRRLLVVLDTTVPWNVFCVVQPCLVYRGRTIPLAWKVLRHPSASVAFRDYRGVLRFAARRPRGHEVVLLADRGFLHGELLRWVGRTADWHFRIRCKRNVGLYRRTGRGHGQLTLRLSAGAVRYDHGVYVTAARLPVHLAVGG